MMEPAAQILQAEKELDGINPIAALVGLARISYRGISLGVCPKAAIIGRYLKAWGPTENL